MVSTLTLEMAADCGVWFASVGSPMDRASDYGSEGWGFESLQAQGEGLPINLIL